VDLHTGVDALVKTVQEADEGDRVVAGDRLDDDLPGPDLQRGDDGHGAVADVLELAARPPARGARQLGIFAVLGLDPGLLIDADHDGVRLGAQVGVAYRCGLGPELFVVAAVQPAPDPVRSQLQVGQDPPDL